MFNSITSERILKSYSQVMLQSNKNTGLLFALAIYIGGSSGQFWGGLLGAFTANIYALATKRDVSKIDDGIYGFNAVLIGIAVNTFFNNWTISILGIMGGSILSILILDFMKNRNWAFLTFPFIMVTWLILGLNYVTDFTQIQPSILWDMDKVIAYKAMLKSFSQVFFVNPTSTFFFFFKDYKIVGGLFIFGLLITMKHKFLYTILGITACIYLSDLILIPKELINNGMVGYNVVLCTALFVNKPKTWLYVLVSAFMCVIIQWMFFEYALIALTAPFVFTSWIVEYLEENLIRESKKQTIVDSIQKEVAP